MKLSPFLTFLTLGIAACGGCQMEDRARSLVEVDPTGGRIALALCGDSARLIKSGRIDLARRFTMPDKTEIDIWVKKATWEKLHDQDIPSPQGTVLVLHALGESKAKHLGLCDQLVKKGFDVVLPDLRAHGASGGKYTTYGVKEKQDVKAVMDQLLREGVVRKPVYAFGASLGGATAIQYAAGEPECKGVLAVTPYKDAPTVCRRALALSAPFLSAEDFDKTLRHAGQLAHFEPNEASTVVAAGRLKCPLHLVHGLIDLTSPLEDTKAVFEAAGEPKKLTVILPHEQLVVAAMMDSWVADRMDELAKTGLKEPATQPAGGTK